MILKNPTDKTVSITIKGIDLSVSPNDTVEVSDAQGQHWLLVHEFLQTVGEQVKVEVVAEKPAPKVEAPVASQSPSAMVPSAPVTPKK